MKYVANPVIVDAFRIEKIQNTGGRSDALILDNGDEVIPGEGMTSRYNPVVGDYWVIQSDGYVYLNPKDVFERKYSAI